MLKSSLCGYSDVYILVNRTIIITNTVTQSEDAYYKDKEVIFMNCAPFTDYITEINITQIDKGKDIDVVMSMFNLIEYNNNY